MLHARAFKILMKLRPAGIEADLQDSVLCQRRGGGRRGQGIAGEYPHFERPNQLLNIMPVNPNRGGWIEALEQAVEDSGPVPFPFRQSSAQSFVPFRQGRKTRKKRLQIKSSAPRDYRQRPARRNPGDYRPRLACILAGRVTLPWVKHVEQVVGNTRAFRRGEFRRSYIEAAIEL